MGFEGGGTTRKKGGLPQKNEGKGEGVQVK